MVTGSQLEKCGPVKVGCMKTSTENFVLERETFSRENFILERETFSRENFVLERETVYI